MNGTTEYKIELTHWTKRTKVMCPVCRDHVARDGRKKNPYTCKCGAILKPFVRMKNE